MSSISNKKIGAIGEKMALAYLKNKGYRLLQKNFYCRWGEIDLIFKKEDKIIFVEVKTRVGDKKGKPYEAVNFYKIKDLKRAISYYLLKKNRFQSKLSLEVVSIILNQDLSLKEIKHFEEVIS
jgi:putative endonuclease